MASEEDKKMAKNWKDDADGILKFTGLFCAAVASLISVSIGVLRVLLKVLPDLHQNPQDTPNFYHAKMYQATINPNTPNISSSPPASPSLLPALYSRRCYNNGHDDTYLKVTQLRYSPHKRARIRAFFGDGVDKFLLSWTVDKLPTMLHLSLFLFFADLAVFL
ncbi:hypothetical protein V8E53_005431 [Lactarius tabidus]